MSEPTAPSPTDGSGDETRARLLRALVVLLYFSLAVVASYFSDFAAWEMSAVSGELHNLESAGKLPADQATYQILATVKTTRRVVHEQAIQGTLMPPCATGRLLPG